MIGSGRIRARLENQQWPLHRKISWERVFAEEPTASGLCDDGVPQLSPSF